MRKHIYKINAIIALTLVLCLGAPFFPSATSAANVASHEHICPEEGLKEYCADIKECCKICLNYYNAKSRIAGLYSSITNTTSTTLTSSQYDITETALLYTVTSLVSLNVRLNN